MARSLVLESLEDRRLLAADTVPVIDSLETFGAAILSKPIEDKPGPGEIVFLAAGPHPDELEILQPNNVAAADSTNADQLQPGGSSGLNLTGAGYTVGVWDGGLVRPSHQEFGGRVSTLETGGLSDHATHVAGTIGAAGVNASALGMASDVNIHSWDFANDTVELWNAAPNLDVSNHSYGFAAGWSISNAASTPGGAFVSTSGLIDVWWEDYSVSSVEDSSFGEYTASSAGIDDVIHDHPHLLSVWSAGNDRNDQFSNSSQDDTYVTFFSLDPGGVGWSGQGWYLVGDGGSTPAPAADGNGGTGYDSLTANKVTKNTLVVGAVHDVTADPYSSGDIITTSFSSYGGTDDGRVKPDVVGNGDGVLSTNASGDTGYDIRSGTSMAAPNVAGSSVLLIEHYNNEFGMSPSAATSKALLIHTATDAGNVGPDYAYGWGLVDVAEAAELVTDASTPGTSSSVREWTYQGTAIDQPVYADGTTPLKVTIAWTDLAGTPVGGLDNTSSMLVNDLDLIVTGPDGTHYPWTLDVSSPTSPALRTTSNHVDNVEQVLIDAPVPGEYTVQVAATGSVSNQDFSIVIEGGSLTGSMVSVVEDVDDGNYAIGELSLREALELANQTPGTQSITFDPNVFSSPQTIHLSSQLPQITEGVNIEGPGAANATIDGGDAHRIFFVFNSSNAIDVSMSGLTLANGRADSGDPATAGDFGGGIYSGEAITLTDMVFVDNVAMNGGGGFYGGGALTRFENVHFVGNEAINQTGGAFHDGNFELINSTVENNSAAEGGGIFGAGLIQSSTIQGNSAEGSGGGLLLNAGTATIIDSTLTGNTADDLGGGIRILDASTLNLTNSMLSGNSSDYGGGIGNAGTANITGSTISGGSATALGGGIYNTGTAIVSDTIVSGNSSDYGGGGISNRGTVNIAGSTISGNVSEDGGGISNRGTVDITGSTISGNVGEDGGGILNRSTGQLTLNNSTLSDNYGYFGGGLSNYGTATVSQSTITDNSAYYGGGLNSSNMGTADVTQSIIAGNLADGGANNILGSLNTNEFNLIDVDPQLGPLVDNGGPTLTHAPLPGSPAINAGDLFLMGNIAPTGIATQPASVLSAQNAIDGDLTTFSSTVPGPIHSWTLDLQDVRLLDEVIVHLKSPSPFALFTVRLAESPGDFFFTSNHSQEDVITLQLGGIDARYVRVEMLDNLTFQSQLEIFEVEVNVVPEVDYDQRGDARGVGGVVDIGSVEADPPVVRTLGSVPDGMSSQPAYNLRAGENVFYRFALDADVAAADGSSLVIDTLGSILTPSNDTEIGLYDANGNLIAENDDLDGSTVESRLLFGDGGTIDLSAGEYYLALGANDTTFNATDFDVSSSSSATGDVVVNFNLQQATTVPCDFDGDGVCSGSDIDLLQENLVDGPLDPATYDLTGDGQVTIADRDEWLVQAGAANLPSGGAYLLGDANLDGTVDGSDFLVWSDNKFQFSSAWTNGDFNSDGAVDGIDFLIWNANKFESSDTPSTHAIPPRYSAPQVATEPIRPSIHDRWFAQSKQDEDDRRYTNANTADIDAALAILSL